MTANQHTPGPWKVEPFVQSINGYPDWHSFTVRHDRTNVHIATVGDVDRYYEQNNQANAEMIAAAPETAAERDQLRDVNADLLAALEWAVARIIVANHEGDPILSALLPDARAAIEKARKGS